MKEYRYIFWETFKYYTTTAVHVMFQSGLDLHQATLRPAGHGDRKDTYQQWTMEKTERKLLDFYPGNHDSKRNEPWWLMFVHSWIHAWLPWQPLLYSKQLLELCSFICCCTDKSKCSPMKVQTGLKRRMYCRRCVIFEGFSEYMSFHNSHPAS